MPALANSVGVCKFSSHQYSVDVCDDFLFGNMHPGDTDAESEAALTTTSTMSTVIPLSTSQVLDGLATEAWDAGEQAQVAGEEAQQAAAIAHAASNEAKSACARLRRATDCARTGKAVPASLRPNFIPPPPPAPDSDHGYHGPGQALAADTPRVAPEPTQKASPPPLRASNNNDGGTGGTAPIRMQRSRPSTRRRKCTRRYWRARGKRGGPARGKRSFSVITSGVKHSPV